MIDLNVKSNIKEVTRHLNDIQKKQVPFAAARALTWTAQDAQSYIQDKIQTIFNITKKWWLKQQPTGIKIIPAKKNHLVSSVYTDAYFGPLQEEGGTKRPRRSKSLLIPTDKTPKSRRKAGGAAASLKAQNVFSDKRGIFRRTGGRKRKNQKLAMLFHRDDSAKIKPRFGFKTMAAKIAAKKFKDNFLKSLEQALKTMR